MVFFSGDGNGELPETDYETEPIDNRLDGVRIMPTTLTVTEVSTLFVAHPTATVHGAGGHQAVISQRYDPPQVQTSDDRGGEAILPTPVLPPFNQPSTFSSTLTIPDPHTGAQPPPNAEGLPLEKYIVRTILHSNMTILHNRVEDFKRAMEEKLTRAYRRAYDKNQLKSRSTRSAAELKSRSTRSAADEDEEEQDVLMFPHGRHMRSAHESGPPHTHQGMF